MIQWLRICLPTQGTQVRFLVRELSISHAVGQLSPRAAITEPVGSRACMPQLEKTMCCNEDPAQPKVEEKIIKKTLELNEFENNIYMLKLFHGASLVVQWLRLRAPNAGGPGSIPGQETRFHVLQLKIPCAATRTCSSQINR